MMAASISHLLCILLCSVFCLSNCVLLDLSVQSKRTKRTVSQFQLFLRLSLGSFGITNHFKLSLRSGHEAVKSLQSGRHNYFNSLLCYEHPAWLAGTTSTTRATDPRPCRVWHTCTRFISCSVFLSIQASCILYQSIHKSDRSLNLTAEYIGDNFLKFLYRSALCFSNTRSRRSLSP